MLDGTTVTLTFEGRLPDGTVYDKMTVENPLVFQVGHDMVLDGFEREVREMVEGEKKTFTIKDWEAFGEHLDEQTEEVPMEVMPNMKGLEGACAMYKNILIAADGSENSLRATQQAADIASLLVDAKVELVSVIAIDVYSDMVYDPIEAHGEAQREILEGASAILSDAGINHEIVLLHGRPADEIIRYAEESGADLLVMGSRGLGALREFALGSVSHKVLTHAKCPVLVVK